MSQRPVATSAAGLVLVDDLSERLPDGLFMLVLPADDGRGGGVEVWRTARGERAVLAFSAIQSLVGACGAGQPWVPMSREVLAEVCAELGVTLVGLDVAPPEGHRYPEPEVAEVPDLEPWEPVERQLLYVASRPMRSWTDLVQLELQPDKRGRLMVLAYTSEEELVAWCGPHQAWVAIPSNLVGEAVARSGADGVLFNPILAAESRHTAPVRDWRDGVTSEKRD
ncbi:SAV_915 family protein [Amycolatopsis alkalitolerans]|uniref:SseB family protein n=1 Tax=Amycolatopsis alkalitolerans TaxID=2547244 RepID=A0A5C4M8J4_9PSEU|nr:SAV_915 family protein [Amycolatopsis alkalitolerans]TNC29173.1 hypothetical protein FG385_03550 [Amycolatopsis alkalitolerans]